MDQPAPADRRISVLLADDQDLVRELLLSLLAREPDIEAEAVADMAGVLRRIEAHGPYDVLLLDFFMPGIEGLEGLAQAMQANGGRPVLLMSGNLPPETVAAATDLGVRGFLPKTRFAALAAMVRAAAAPPAAPPDAGLTEAERALLADLARGVPGETLARAQGAGFEARLQALFDKLGARNRTHAILAAKRLGLV